MIEILEAEKILKTMLPWGKDKFIESYHVNI